MTPEPATIGASASLEEAAKLLVRHGVRHLPVIDDAGVLLGVATDFAVLQRGKLTNQGFHTWRIEDVGATAADAMVSLDVVIGPNTSLVPVIAGMLATTQDVAMVVDGARKPVGILTEHDVVRFARDTLPSKHWSAVIPPSDIVSIRPARSANEVFELMCDHRIRHVLVLGADLIGVIALRDVIREGVTRGRNMTAAEMVKQQKLITLPEGVAVHEAADLMLTHRIGCVPLVNRKFQPTGIVTRTDLALTALRGVLAQAAK
jgi:CBS domain-containing protein